MKIPNACSCGDDCTCQHCKRTYLDLEILDDDNIGNLGEK